MLFKTIWRFYNFNLLSIILLIIFSITTFRCTAQESVLEDITKEILLEEYPESGVFSLSVQGAEYAPDKDTQCNPDQIPSLKLLCEAEANCQSSEGTEKLVCIYDSLDNPMELYENSLEELEREENSRHTNENHGNESHDSESTEHAVWNDIKHLYKELKELVKKLNNTDDPDDQDHDNDGDDDENDQYTMEEGDHDGETIAEEIQEIYTLIQTIKERYNSTNDLKILTHIESIELKHPQNGWVKISTSDDTEVDIAILDLNRVVAINAVEPGLYTDIQITFKQSGYIQYRPPAGTSVDTFLETIPDIEYSNGYLWFPLEFQPNASRTRIIHREISIVKSKAVDFAISPNVKRSISEENNQFYFDPVFYVKQVSGDEYSDPLQPVNVTLDNGNLSVQADAEISDKPIKIDAIPIVEADLPKPMQGENTVLLGAYDMKPDMVFKKSIALTFKYDPDVLARNGLTSENIRASYFHKDRNRWIHIPNPVIDTMNNTVTVHTNHFTIVSITGQSGFTLDYNDAVAGKIHYSALNYIIEKAHAVNPSVLSSEKITFNYNGNGLFGTGTLFLNEFDSRNLKFSVGGPPPGSTEPNIISVKISLSNYRLGKITANVHKPIGLGSDVCNKFFNSCYDGCSSWFGPLQPVCHAGCGLVAVLCNTYDASASAVAEATINDFSVTLNYRVVRDANTGVPSFTYAGSQTGDFNIHIDTTHFNFQSFNPLLGPLNVLISIVVDLLENTIADQMKFNHNIGDKIVKEIGNGEEGSISKKIEDSLNTTLADTRIEPNFKLDALGIEFFSKINAYIPAPQMAATNCSVSFNTSFSPTESTFPLSDQSDVGMGFSLTAMNQVFNELANRGYFCYDYQIDPNTVVSVQPVTAPEIKYLGNYLFRLRLTAEAQLKSFNIPLITDQAALDIYYRVSIDMGGNELRINAVKIIPEFSNATIQNAANSLFALLNQNMLDQPELFGYSVILNNPLNYADVQHSMFRLNMIEESNGLLAFGIDLSGLKLDYENPNGGSEWVWTKNWGKFTTQRCASKVTGTLQNAPAGSSTRYELVFDNGEEPIPFEPPSGYFIPQVGTTATYEGSCIIDPLTNTQKYFANNIINDQFYIGTNGFPLPKRNYAAQVIAEFDTTVGLYPVNITGNDTPEILQVELLPNNEYQLDWIISNTCCQNGPADVVKYSMALPEEFQPKIITPSIKPESLYRVEIIKAGSGSDQLLLNCYVYDVSVVNAQVVLSFANQICQDPYAGMVADSSNGRMWTNCVIGQHMYDPDCAGDFQIFSDDSPAKTSCSNLEISGFADWRLPNEADFNTLNYSTASLFPNPNGVYYSEGSTSKDIIVRAYGDDSWNHDHVHNKYIDYFKYAKLHNSILFDVKVNIDGTVSTQGFTAPISYYNVPGIWKYISSFASITTYSRNSYVTEYPPETLPQNMPADYLLINSGINIPGADVYISVDGGYRGSSGVLFYNSSGFFNQFDQKMNLILYNRNTVKTRCVRDIN